MLNFCLVPKKLVGSEGKVTGKGTSSPSRHKNAVGIFAFKDLSLFFPFFPLSF